MYLYSGASIRLALSWRNQHYVIFFKFTVQDLRGQADDHDPI